MENKVKILKLLGKVLHPWWNIISKKKKNRKILLEHMKKLMLQCKAGDDNDY